MTALDLIKAAMRICGRTSQGNPLSAEDSQNGLESLQILVNAWKEDNLLLYAYQTITASMTAGKASYTIGESSADITAPRPTDINEIFIRDTNGNDNLVSKIYMHDYQLIVDKDANGRPYMFWYNPTTPNGTLVLWPVQDTAGEELRITCLYGLEEPSLLTTEMAFPSAYDAAIKWNLAIELADEYGIALSNIAVANANRTLYRLQRNNAVAQMRPARVSTPSSSSSTYDIYTDQ